MHRLPQSGGNPHSFCKSGATRQDVFWNLPKRKKASSQHIEGMGKALSSSLLQPRPWLCPPPTCSLWRRRNSKAVPELAHFSRKALSSTLTSLTLRQVLVCPMFHRCMVTCPNRSHPLGLACSPSHIGSCYLQPWNLDYVSHFTCTVGQLALSPCCLIGAWVGLEEPLVAPSGRFSGRVFIRCSPQVILRIVPG